MECLHYKPFYEQSGCLINPTWMTKFGFTVLKYMWKTAAYSLFISSLIYIIDILSLPIKFLFIKKITWLHFLQTHPNVDKKKFANEGLISLRNPAKPFPLNQDIGVLKWRFQTQNDDYMPLASKYSSFSYSFELKTLCCIMNSMWENKILWQLLRIKSTYSLQSSNKKLSRNVRKFIS